MTEHSPEYIQHYKSGPFPGRIDLWAEAGRYFQQIHSGMIDNLLDQLQDRLIALDYQAGREASLQIFANRQPDIYVQRSAEKPTPAPAWSYEAAASDLELEPGIAVIDEEPELEAIHITDAATGALVTVVEIISPRNKTHSQDIALYRAQRESVFLRAGVNVVEIDATRSTHRLLNHTLVHGHPYHIAIYLPGEPARVLVSAFDDPAGPTLKPFALPLRAEAVPAHPQTAYDRAYQRGAIAGLINTETRYDESALPFASLLPDDQHLTALAAVGAWQARLADLRS